MAGQSIISEERINWGGIIKGAAIVVGIVAVAAVGAWLFGATFDWASLAAENNEIVKNLLTETGKLFAPVKEALGLNAIETISAKSTAMLAGAGALGAAAVHAGTPALAQTHYTIPVDVDPGLNAHNASLLASQGAHASLGQIPMHDVTHMAHHAAEHASEHARNTWTDRIAPQNNQFTSHSDAVRHSKPSSIATAQRADSFAEQLNADRASLEQALAK